MPATTPELAWWVMTGAIAALLSLITVMVGIIGYLLKTGFDKLNTQITQVQTNENRTEKSVVEIRATCKERHERIDDEISDMKQAIRSAA